MSGTFSELSEAFNTAAQKFPSTNENVAMLLTRYELLLKYKAEDDAQKAELVGTLYACGLKMLQRYAAPSTDRWIYGDYGKNIQAVMRTLSDPATLPYIPEQAPTELADAAFNLLSRADNIGAEYFSSSTRQEEFKDSVVSFAGIALKAANTFRASIEERTIDIKTSKVITPARKLVLKAKDEPPASGPQP